LVYRLLKLVLVLPIATTSVERCFSAMKLWRQYYVIELEMKLWMIVSYALWNKDF
jgi:hypothetical protein